MVIAVVRDTSRRKLAEEQLRRSGEQLRALAARLQQVREEERTRMAREVHDELGQALTGLKMELASTRKALTVLDDGDARDVDGRIRAMTSLIDEMIDSVRRIASDLRPVVLDELGLVAAIEWQARDFERRTGIQCDVAGSAPEVELDRETTTAVFRIYQEILTNAARHAEATRLEVSLSREDGRFVLRVADDGRGITRQETAGRDSLGLLGIRERAVIFGGEVEIEGVAGSGTTVTVRVPQQPHRPADGEPEASAGRPEAC